MLKTSGYERVNASHYQSHLANNCHVENWVRVIAAILLCTSVNFTLPDGRNLVLEEIGRGVKNQVEWLLKVNFRTTECSLRKAFTNFTAT